MRYKLVAISEKYGEKIIPISEESDKVKLIDIDEYTTQFNNIDDLLEELYYSGKIEDNNSKLLISYQYNGETKYEPIIFRDCKFYTKLFKDNVLNEQGRFLVNAGIKTVKEENMVSYLEEQKVLNDSCINLLKDYQIGRIEVYNLLIKTLSDYKTFRDFNYLINKYYKDYEKRVEFNINDEKTYPYEFIEEDDYKRL